MVRYTLYGIWYTTHLHCFPTVSWFSPRFKRTACGSTVVAWYDIRFTAYGIPRTCTAFPLSRGFPLGFPPGVFPLVSFPWCPVSSWTLGSSEDSALHAADTAAQAARLLGRAPNKVANRRSSAGLAHSTPLAAPHSTGDSRSSYQIHMCRSSSYTCSTVNISHLLPCLHI